MRIDAQRRFSSPERPVEEPPGLLVIPPCHPGDMSKSKDQLALLQPSEGRWRIDPATRELGRRGLEEARRALAEARAANKKAA